MSDVAKTEPDTQVANDQAPNTNAQSTPLPLTSRMKRALYQPMVTVGHLDRARDNPGVYEVYTTGDPYLVDLNQETCECGDFRFRAGDSPCKHIYRAWFATGDVDIPNSVDKNQIDGCLGECVER